MTSPWASQNYVGHYSLFLTFSRPNDEWIIQEIDKESSRCSAASSLYQQERMRIIAV